MWRAVLLTSLIVTAVGTQDEQSDVEVSDADEDLSLDEEELKVLMAEGEEKATVTDKDETGMSGEKKGDENVSFQVRNRQCLQLNLQRSSLTFIENMTE